MSLFEIATAAHIAGSLILSLFFVLLARHDARPYLRAWAGAWMAQALALMVLLMAGFAATRLGLTFYLFLATTHGVLVAAAAQSFARGLSLRSAHAGILAAVLIWSLAGPSLSMDRSIVHAAQFLLLCASYFTAAAVLWPLQEPTGMGLRLTVKTLALTGLAYGLQAAAFGQSSAATAGSTLYLEAAPFAIVFIQMLLGLGIALAVTEGGFWALVATQQQLKDAERRLKLLSETDRLTGCANRQVFRDLVEDLRMRGKGATGVVLLLDVDGFKAINERGGHDAGDDALRAVAEAIRGRTRPSDIVVRWGGDEFLVVIPGATPGDAEGRVSELDVDIGLAGYSASAGLAAYGPETEILAAVREAERAMRDARGIRRKTDVGAGA